MKMAWAILCSDLLAGLPLLPAQALSSSCAWPTSSCCRHGGTMSCCTAKPESPSVPAAPASYCPIYPAWTSNRSGPESPATPIGPRRLRTASDPPVASSGRDDTNGLLAWFSSSFLPRTDGRAEGASVVCPTVTQAIAGKFVQKRSARRRMRDIRGVYSRFSNASDRRAGDYK